MLSTEYRNTLYYNKYKYKTTIQVKGVVYTHWCSTYSVFLEKMKTLQSHVDNTRKPPWKVYYIKEENGEIKSDIIDYVVIEKYYKFFDEHKDIPHVRHRLSDTVTVFSNDLNFIQKLSSFEDALQITEVTALNKDTMYFKKKPLYKMRTYFKEGLPVPTDYKENINRFLDTHKKGTNMSWGLVHYALTTQEMHYTRKLYIEYDDSNMQTMIHMLFGNIVGKTYICEQKPQN
jgi:hypothetical protein